jgi:hypothetical protein
MKLVWSSVEVYCVNMASGVGKCAKNTILNSSMSFILLAYMKVLVKYDFGKVTYTRCETYIHDK